MSDRPEPGTAEEEIYNKLLPAVSRAGRAVDTAECARLARLIQRVGRIDKEVRRMAKTMGLDPKYLPRKRRS
jgi:hypothetical protein